MAKERPRRASKGSGATVTSEHKQAMAQGRAEGRAVKNYLDLLGTAKRGRGRPRTIESVRTQLDAVEEALIEAALSDRVELVQQRMNLQAELRNLEAASGLEDAEAEFVDVAKPYSERKGISWAAWREVGVPTEVLRRAGLSRRYEKD